ncbi:MAG TPA: SDR family NAD(P)-dependent oxidoreductase [Verrucomicrobiae bacterium]|nr:SDR family NAD(P)-dependent oxidoreductase [Verrucomicrobiae bacterium]
MNFLITGGAGFIGSHVGERLLGEGHSVWVFDAMNASYDPRLKQRNVRLLQALGKPFEFVQGDITDRAALDELFSSVKFDQVIHLAGQAGVRPSLAQPALYQRVNVEATVNVLEAARLNGANKIIIASSAAVYGINSKSPFSESDPIFSAISPYAASKLACESLGHVWHHLYKMDVAMLRLFTAYGPRQRPELVLYKFAKLISDGKPIPVFGDGSLLRDYTYIGDTVDGIIACTKKELGFEIFNIGDSMPISLAHLIESLEEAMGKKAMIDRQPLQPGDMPLTYADISKAQEKLGYHPKVKFEQGVKLFVDWFLKEDKAGAAIYP